MKLSIGGETYGKPFRAKKDCFLVTAYCDTDEKKEVLKETLSRLNRSLVFKKDIILFSHYPVEEDIISLTDYTIFDYSNPIMDLEHSSTIHWKKYKYYKINTLYLDYGYAAVQQWKRGLTYAYNLGYDAAYVLNYDLDVTNELIRTTERDLKYYCNVILDYGKVKMNDGGQYKPALHMSFFALRLRGFLNQIMSINYNDYYQKSSFGITENYMFEKFHHKNSLIYPYKNWKDKVKTLIKMDTDFIKHYYIRDGYKWIMGEEKIWVKNKEIGTNKCILFLFDIEKDLDVKISIDNKIIHSSIVPSKLQYHLIYLPFKYDEVKNYIGEYKNNKFYDSNKKLKISINNLDIPRELIKLTPISAIEVANDNV
tara:strand:+ start:4203 stop:5306 length:1104 start_codon:yes stop_codon:yes gene_type:complete